MENGLLIFLGETGRNNNFNNLTCFFLLYENGETILSYPNYPNRSNLKTVFLDTIIPVQYTEFEIQMDFILVKSFVHKLLHYNKHAVKRKTRSSNCFWLYLYGRLLEVTKRLKDIPSKFYGSNSSVTSWIITILFSEPSHSPLQVFRQQLVQLLCRVNYMILILGESLIFHWM